MITDGVHEPTGSKRHRGAGHPWHLPSLPATPSKRCRGASSPIPCADDVPHDSPRGQQSVVPRHPADTASTDAQPGLAWPGQRRTVREHDTRGNGGGFAPLEAFCRRVAGVSRLYWCNSPRLVAVRMRSGAVRSRSGAVRMRFGAVRMWSGAVRSRSGAVRCPHRRPPRRQTPTMGCRGRGVLRCGHKDAWPRASLAREPAITSASLLFRTSTRYSVSGRGCPRSH